MQRTAAVTLSVLLVATLAGSTASQSQSCLDSGARSAVCAVEFRGGLDGDRLRRYDPTRPFQIPLGRTLDLELEAYDQRSRLFDRDRLAFGVDFSDCEDVAEIEETRVGRFEIETGSRRGDCEFWLWVPGNLNLEWRIELVVESRGLAGFSRAEAEYIAERLYRGLLGREPDPQGLRDTTLEIQRGDMSGRIDDMVRSSEFRGLMLGSTPAALLEQLYQGIFEREPDSSGVAAFLPDLERGAVAEVVKDLVRSEEFETRLIEAMGSR